LLTEDDEAELCQLVLNKPDATLEELVELPGSPGPVDTVGVSRAGR
jgi:hypothetical protein